MADAAINALRDESMVLNALEGDRPICTQVSVRPVEEPEADHQADHTGDERASVLRVLSERKRWRRDPDQRYEESDPGAYIDSPDAHAVGRREVELVSGLDIECRVPCIEVAHSDRPEQVGGVGVSHHLLPEKSFTRL